MARDAVLQNEARKMSATTDYEPVAADLTPEIRALLATKAAKFAIFILGTDGEPQCIASPNASIRASVSRIVYEELQISPQCAVSEMSSVIAQSTPAVFDSMTMNHSPNHANQRRLLRADPLGGSTSQRRSMISRRDRARAFSMAMREPVPEKGLSASVRYATRPGDDAMLFDNAYTVDVTDEEQVVAFAFKCLSKIQHLANKAIAKIFIKRVCPKKQAIYPYTKNGVEQVPAPWWPPVEQCKYTEPDHISKDERERLLVHLLRLRPTPEQLDEWNQESGNDLRRDRDVHVREGWTCFLRGSFAAEDIATKNDCPGKLQQRRRWLEDLFAVAELEEDWIRNGQVHRYFVLGPRTDDESDGKIKLPRRRKRVKQASESSVEGPNDTQHGLGQASSQQTPCTPLHHNTPALHGGHQTAPESDRKSRDADPMSKIVERNDVAKRQPTFIPNQPEMESQYQRQNSCNWATSPTVHPDAQQDPTTWQNPNPSPHTSFCGQPTQHVAEISFNAGRYQPEEWAPQSNPDGPMVQFFPVKYQDVQAPNESSVPSNAFDPTPYAEYFRSQSQYDVVPSPGFLHSPKAAPDQLGPSVDSTGWTCQNEPFQTTIPPNLGKSQDSHSMRTPPDPWRTVDLPYHGNPYHGHHMTQTRSYQPERESNDRAVAHTVY